MLIVLAGAGVGADWWVRRLNQGQPVVSGESTSTVQSAHISVFQTPYFKFQAGEHWREVTDELNLTNEGGSQYLYRKFEKDFITHELWVTVNMPADQKLLKHNIPTRVMLVRIEPDGRLTQTEPVSDTCAEVLGSADASLEPHTLKQKGVTYFCNPNANDFTVAVGVPGGTVRLPFVSPSTGESYEMTITYRNIKAIPDEHEMELIMKSFTLL